MRTATHSQGAYRATALAVLVTISLAACNQPTTPPTGQPPAAQQPGMDNGQQPPASNPGDSGTTNPPGGGTTNPPTGSNKAASGSLDPSFGNEGVLIAPIPGALAGRAPSHAIADMNGRILVTGTNTSGDNDVAVARYLPNGNLDTSFGTGGVSTIVNRSPYGNLPARQKGDASLPLPDGGLITVGSGTEAGYEAPVLYHLSEGGQNDGTYTSNSSGYAFRNLVRQPDRKVVATSGVWPTWRSSVARLNPDGTLDRSFDGDGIAEVDFVPDDNPQEGAIRVAVAPDGKILAVARVGAASAPSRHYLVRFMPDGRLDGTFSGDGIAEVTFGGRSWYRGFSLAVDSQGRPLAAGVISNDATPEPNDVLVAVERFTSAGAPDTTFGSGGTTVPDYPYFPNVITPDVALAVDASDRPLLLLPGVDASYRGNLYVLRLNTAGSPDSSFSGDGVTVVPAVSMRIDISTITLDAAGHITVAGFTTGAAGDDRWHLIAGRINP